jgi:pimeloyl-ACP methyl ester carboxylesterase
MSPIVFSESTSILTDYPVILIGKQAPVNCGAQGRGAPVLSALAEPHRALAAALFEQMRSGSGFCADLRNFTDIAGYRETAAGVAQAALVIASPTDGAVPFAHARTLADALPNARLIASQAPGHFIWFSDDYPAIAAAITSFLEADPAASPGS